MKKESENENENEGESDMEITSTPREQKQRVNATDKKREIYFSSDENSINIKKLNTEKEKKEKMPGNTIPKGNTISKENSLDSKGGEKEDKNIKRDSNEEIEEIKRTSSAQEKEKSEKEEREEEKREIRDLEREREKERGGKGIVSKKGKKKKIRKRKDDGKDTHMNIVQHKHNQYIEARQLSQLSNQDPPFQNIDKDLMARKGIFIIMLFFSFIHFFTHL